MQKNFVLLYSLRLIFGMVFTVVLLITIGSTVSYMLNLNQPTVSVYDGSTYTVLLSFLLITGLAHILLARFTYAPKAQDEKNLYIRIISTAFVIVLCGIAAGYAIALVFPLIVWIFALNDMSANDILTPVMNAVFVLPILGLMIAYQLGARVKNIYTWVLSGVIVAVVVIFAIFPASRLRDLAHDQKMVDDLYVIDMAVQEYTSSRNKLPANLAILPIEGLNHPLNNYSYYPPDTITSARPVYQLCSDNFKTDTNSTNVNTNDFTKHNAGVACFDLTAYLEP